MDWLKKLLEGKGLAEDQVKAIVDGVEDNYKTFIPKQRFDEVNEAKKQAEASVRERDTQLTELKKSVGDNDALTQKINELQTANKQAATDYENKIKDMSVTSAIEKALGTAQAKFPDLLLGKIDRSKVELLQDGTVKGLEDQITTLKTNYKDLFGETVIIGGPPGMGGNPNPIPDLSDASDSDFFQKSIYGNK